jgi:hypothetical protein
MDSDDDYSSGGASSGPSRSSVELSPHPEEENIAPHGSISNANSGKSRITAQLDAVSNANSPDKENLRNGGVPATPKQPASVTKRRRIGSPTASISFDGAHATPPSAIGGGLMPSPEKKKTKLDIPSSSSQIAPAAAAVIKAKGKNKATGQGEGWEEVLERLGATAC